MDTSIFKSYDIRGLCPEELDEDAAHRIGRALIDEFAMRTVAVGRDARATSDLLFAALTRGMLEAGANVIDLGRASTPMVYFASATLDVDGAVSITASHNPASYNGFKLNRKHAVPIGAGTGMERIRDRALAEMSAPATTPGTIDVHDIGAAYRAHVRSLADLARADLELVIDCGNGMGGLEVPIFQGLAPGLRVRTLYGELDMSFPNHEANPLNTETLADLRQAVTERSAQLGMAYDGDADRVGFVDEMGRIVRMDTITSIIAEDILRTQAGATILYDLRSSRAVKEHIEACGGRAAECRVGHAHIKHQMAETGAAFAGECSGHYYFKDNSYAESASLAALRLLNVMARSGKSLSALAAAVERYAYSGEINSTVDNARAVLRELEETYHDGAVSHMDGLKVVYDDWWFNVRASNTELLLRLNVEADTDELMQRKRDELLARIRTPHA